MTAKRGRPKGSTGSSFLEITYEELGEYLAPTDLVKVNKLWFKKALDAKVKKLQSKSNELTSSKNQPKTPPAKVYKPSLTADEKITFNLIDLNA